MTPIEKAYENVILFQLMDGTLSIRRMLQGVHDHTLPMVARILYQLEIDGYLQLHRGDIFGLRLPDGTICSAASLRRSEKLKKRLTP